jgi:hypothetical protein
LYAIENENLTLLVVVIANFVTYFSAENLGNAWRLTDIFLASVKKFKIKWISSATKSKVIGRPFRLAKISNKEVEDFRVSLTALKC